MARELLVELIRLVDRLIVAGAGAAAGSEKLLAFIEPLSRLAVAVPAVGPVADIIERLRQSTSATAPKIFLELLSLTRQLRYAIFSTESPNELREIEPNGTYEWETPLHRRDVEHLRERMERFHGESWAILVSVVRNRRILDLRLVGPMLTLLDHGGSTGDLIYEDVLPIFGSAIVPDLMAAIDIRMGDSLTVRKLKLVEKLDLSAALGLIRRIVAEGHVELKEIAVALLPRVVSAEEVERVVLPLLDDSVPAIRAVAFKALRGSTSRKVIDRLWHLYETGDRPTRKAAGKALGQ